MSWKARNLDTTFIKAMKQSAWDAHTKDVVTKAANDLVAVSEALHQQATARTLSTPLEIEKETFAYQAMLEFTGTEKGVRVTEMDQARTMGWGAFQYLSQRVNSQLGIHSTFSVTEGKPSQPIIIESPRQAEAVADTLGRLMAPAVLILVRSALGTVNIQGKSGYAYDMLPPTVQRRLVTNSIIGHLDFEAGLNHVLSGSSANDARIGLLERIKPVLLRKVVGKK